MTPDEERELLGRLMDVIESLFLQKILLTSALDLFAGHLDWRSHVEKAVPLHAERIRVMLQPLHDVVLGNPVEILQESEWQDVVRKLIESADKTPPPE